MRTEFFDWNGKVFKISTFQPIVLNSNKKSVKKSDKVKWMFCCTFEKREVVGYDKFDSEDEAFAGAVVHIMSNE